MTLIVSFLPVVPVFGAKNCKYTVLDVVLIEVERSRISLILSTCEPPDATISPIAKLVSEESVASTTTRHQPADDSSEKRVRALPALALPEFVAEVRILTPDKVPPDRSKLASGRMI